MPKVFIADAPKTKKFRYNPIMRSLLPTALSILFTFLLVGNEVASANDGSPIEYRGMTTATSDSQDLLDLAATGANIVGYQIIWVGADTATVQEYNDWLDAQLTVIDALLSACQSSDQGSDTGSIR